MKNINQFILERLKITKNSKIGGFKIAIIPFFTDNYDLVDEVCYELDEDDFKLLNDKIDIFIVTVDLFEKKILPKYRINAWKNNYTSFDTVLKIPTNEEENLIKLQNNITNYNDTVQIGKFINNVRNKYEWIKE